MKRIIYFTGILLAGAMISFYSCTKENQTSNMQQASTLVENNGLSPTDLKVNALINNFRQKVAWYRENPQLKSGESVPADSALWYLEATINYAHAFPNEYYRRFEVDTSYLSVPVSGDGTVDMALLAQKYDEMKANVADDYHNSAFAEKGLGYVALTEISQNPSQHRLPTMLSGVQIP